MLLWRVSSSHVTVFSASPAEQLRKSAYVVTVVETETAQREGGDLGDVLARRSPVSVQRASGLGSRTNLSLGGLGGERLRFFVDGVPLEHMGYLARPANVPVNLVDRIDVFQGTVPVQLAGDALGGAVNLVTDDALGLFSDFTPKFVKRFAELGGEIERAAKAYAEEVNNRRFPGLENCYGVAKDKKD